MRFLKICFIIISFIIVIGLSYALLYSFLKEGATGVPRFGYLYIGLAIIFSIVNILYHLKSFRFYRRKEKQNLDKRLSKLLWIGAICFSAFQLLLVGTSLYNNSNRYIQNTYKSEDLFLICIFTFLGLLGFLEVSLLRKRIKQLKTELDTKEEINEIGNLTV